MLSPTVEMLLSLSVPADCMSGRVQSGRKMHGTFPSTMWWIQKRLNVSTPVG